jgi:hypothetical protein
VKDFGYFKNKILGIFLLRGFVILKDKIDFLFMLKVGK